MKKLLYVLFFAFSFVEMHAQSNSSKVDPPLTIVEEMPAFPGGEVQMHAFINKNIHYPKKMRGKGISGTVYINFVVEKDGKISNARVLRGVSNGPLLDKAALDVVNKMPAWIPGMQSGKTVRVFFNLPIKFL